MKALRSPTTRLSCRYVAENFKEELFFAFFSEYHITIWSWSSSESTLCDYILDDRGSIPGRGKGFSL
jgi:hypothetical protein